jgi:hypothetical protein
MVDHDGRPVVKIDPADLPQRANSIISAARI